MKFSEFAALRRPNIPVTPSLFHGVCNLQSRDPRRFESVVLGHVFHFAQIADCRRLIGYFVLYLRTY
jgi:hypothetical protein